VITPADRSIGKTTDIRNDLQTNYWPSNRKNSINGQILVWKVRNKYWFIPLALASQSISLLLIR
jgi:hypothetical protein